MHTFQVNLFECAKDPGQPDRRRADPGRPDPKKLPSIQVRARDVDDAVKLLKEKLRREKRSILSIAAQSKHTLLAYILEA